MADDNDKRLLEEARKLPLDERVEHKNWKVRSEALDYIKQQVERAFSPGDPIFAEAGPLMRPLVGDTNANVMDKALEVLGAYLEKADEAQASRIAGPVSSTIAAKALKARPGTLAKACEVCMLFVELEQQAAVVEGIMKAFTDKVPKVVVAALDILTKAVSSFGTGVMDFRTILKALPTVFGASNSDVRNKAKELTVELAAFLGRAVVEAALLEKMPAAMKKDVEALLAELPPGKRKPERFTRKEQAARGELPEGGAEPMEVDEEVPVAPAAVEEEDPGMDAYEFAPPKDILGPLAKESVMVGDDKVLFGECFESKKWAVRKKALERVREMATTTRLATGDYGELVRELKRVLAKDANITCAAEAASVAGLLGTGLRKDFASYAKHLVPPILERFKEKNIVMSKAAEESLRALFEHCISVVEAAEDLVEACGHKNPKVRLDTVKLLKDVLEKTPKAQITKVQGSLLPVLANLAGDSDANIRDAAQGAMVVFAVKAGSMAVLDKVMTKLDDSRKKKIEEMVQEAVKAGPAGGRAKAGPAAAAAASAALNRSGSGASSRSGASAAAPSKAANPPLAPKNTNRPSAMASMAAGGPKGGAGAPARRTTTGSSAGGAAKPRAAAGGSGGADDDDAMVSAPKMSNEDLEQHMLEMFGGELVESLKSAKWQDRLEGMGTVLTKVEEQGESADPGLLIQAVGSLPGWGDKNFQVLNKLFELVALVAKLPAFGKREVVYAMEGLAEKVHEIKHKEKVFEALSLASEAAGPGFVMSLLHKKAAANKNPKVLSEALGWMAEAVEAFGLGTMNVKSIIDWMKTDLASASAPVRNKAMEVLGKCHAQLGPALNAFMEGLKPAQLTALEDVFKQNPQTEVVPTRKSRRGRKAPPPGAAAAGEAAAAAAEEEEEEEAPAVSLDDLLPRTDISGRITPSLLSMITSANWKERNAGVLEVEQILKEANSRIGPNVGELMPAMKGRLADSNRNLAAKALTVMADICRAMGPAFDKQSRQLLGPALANISDNKKVVRDSVLVLLDAWLTISPAEKLFPAVLEAIASPKCITDGKVTGLQWIAKVVGEGHASKAGDVAMRAVLLGTSDKAVGVREAGSALLQELGKVLGREALLQSCGTLDGPTKRSAQELIVKTFGGSLGGSGGGTIAASRPGTAASKAAEPPSRVAVRANSSRLAQVAAAAVGGGRAGATAGGSGPSTPKAALLSLSHGKGERTRKYRVRPGRFDGVNSEEQEIMERELGAVASDELRALLFAKDFKKHLDAADRLSAALPSLLEEVKASLDLLFRWVVARICDGNMQSLVKVLELTKVILEALMDCGHSLTDYEAALLLPCVVEKSGHNQDRVRGLHRDVMRLCCNLISPAKVVDYLVVALGSKNNRTKIECCEEIGAIVEREGMGPLLSCKAKPVAALATLLPERDGATRAAALATIELVWVEEADGVWKLLGNLENRIREMVEDRLRRSKLQPKFQLPAPTPSVRRPVTSGYPPTVEVPPPMYARHAQSDSLEYARGGFTPPAPLDTPAPGRPAYGMPMAAGGYGMPPPAYAMPPVPQQPAYSALPTPVPPPRAPVLPDVPPFSGDEVAFREQWMHAMFGINSPDMREVVDNMKALCGDIMAVAMAEGPAAAGCRAIMATSANELFSTINRLMPKLLDSAEHDAAMTGTAPSSRGCKYALNVLLQGIAVHEVSMALPQATLRETISLLLLLLLDERGLVNYEEGSTLMKAINVLMLKMLEATNRTYTFSALLQLLREPPPEIRTEQLPKFYDLVVKCLIKLTKSLQTTMEGLDLQELLFSVHDFFMALGVDEIRKRSSLDDKPLRMVKTILHELCKMKGYEIYEYAKNIPGRNSEPQPIILAYIGLNLQTLQQTGLIQGPENGDASGAMDGSQASDAAGGGSGEDAHAKAAALSSAEKAEVKSRLKDIMGRLMQPDQTAAAMEELYWLRREHSMYVEKYLSTAKVSESFQRYINDGLEEVEQRMAGGGGQPAAALHDGEEHYDQENGEEVGDSGAGSAATPQRTVPRLTLGGGLPPRAAPSPAGSSRALGSTLGSAFGGSGALAAAGSGSFMVSPDRQGGQLSQRASGSGGAGESYMVSPGRAMGAGGALSARSDGSQSARLSGVRERLSMLRMGGDGGSATLSSLLAGGGGGSGAGMGAPSPLSARSNVDVTNMRSSIEELQARMETLRRSQG